MAWHVQNRGKKYCVINDDTGRSVKCYNMITEAEAHSRALNSTKTGVRSKVSALKKKVGPRGKTKVLWKQK